MTVIVWDGQTLATDRMANDGVVKWESPKAWYVAVDNRMHIVTGFGKLKHIVTMRDWFKDGADPNTFPMFTDASQLVVVNDEGLFRYENSPTPIPHGFSACAFGSGRDFAYGALAMGADAVQAVEAANRYSMHCGLGVEVFQLKDQEIKHESSK